MIFLKSPRAGTKHTAEFRQEAVRVALSSGLTRKQIASDFGVGFSTLSRWIQLDRQNPEIPAAQSDLERENAELRKSRCFLGRQHSSSRAKSHDGTARQIFAWQILRGFKFIEENIAMLPAKRLCQFMNVSPRGYRAYQSRPISQSQRKDMVLLAHIREQHQLYLDQRGLAISGGGSGLAFTACHSLSWFANKPLPCSGLGC